MINGEVQGHTSFPRPDPGVKRCQKETSRPLPAHPSWARPTLRQAPPEYRENSYQPPGSHPTCSVTSSWRENTSFPKLQLKSWNRLSMAKPVTCLWEKHSPRAEGHRGGEGWFHVEGDRRCPPSGPGNRGPLQEKAWAPRASPSLVLDPQTPRRQAQEQGKSSQRCPWVAVAYQGHTHGRLPTASMGVGTGVQSPRGGAFEQQHLLECWAPSQT